MKFSSLSLFTPSDLKDNIIIFNLLESHHILNVKKIPRNHIFFATDGFGIIYKLRLIDVKDKNALAEVIEIYSNSGYLPFKITIAVSLCEKKRFEFIVEKLTELGVSEIIPLITKRANKINLNYDRLNKISISAIKQSGRSKFLKIKNTIDIVDFFNVFDEYKNFYKVVMDLKYENSYINTNKNKLLFIGPEGGWTQDEISYFQENNCNFINFGFTTLRVETAAIAGTVLLIN